ncbi:MAG: hypothetical protein ABI772_08495 [Bacteroidota bacterium]
MMKNKMHNDEEAIKKLLKESGLESPSSDFTRNLMSALAPERKPVFTGQPIFSRNQVIFFISLFSIILLYAAVSGSTFSIGRVPDFTIAEDLISKISTTFSSPLLLIVMISGWVLYILDSFMKRTLSS